MPLILARRGRCIFRQLNLRETLPTSAHVLTVPSHVRRVSQFAGRRPSRLITASSSLRGILNRSWANSYATAAGRPKAHTGKTAAKSSTPKSKLTKNTTGKTTKSATRGNSKKSEKKTEKKAKKTTAQKTTSKPKKALSEKQKEKKALDNRKQEIKELKQVALKEPAMLSHSAYSIFIQQNMANRDKSQPVQAQFKALSEAWKTLPDADKETIKLQAEANAKANAAAYESWVKSYDAAQIRQANLARKRLAFITKSNKRPVKMFLIRDDRQVKQPRGQFQQFFVERTNSGDLNHMSLPDRAARIAEEWHGLTAQEKVKYEKSFAQDRERYIREFRSTYGEDPGFLTRNKRKEATA